MKSVAAAFIFLLSSLLLSPTYAEDLALKDIKLGSSVDEFLKAYPYYSPGWSSPGHGGSCGKQRTGMHRCTYEPYLPESPEFTVAGVNASLSLLYHDNKLVQIDARFYRPEEHFAALLDAFKGKYSAPASLLTPTEQNGYGAQVQNVVAIWNMPDGQIILMKYAGTLEQSSLMISSKQFLDEEKAKAAGANKDL